MTTKFEWVLDAEHRIYRTRFDDQHDLLVADRPDARFDVLVLNAVSGETLWESDKTYVAAADAKRAGVAAAKRISGIHVAPVVSGKADHSAEMEYSAPSSTEFQSAKHVQSIWHLHEGRYVATIQKAAQSARCAIVPLDPDHYLGFIRLNGMVLRIPYSNLHEAKRGLVTRIQGLLDQVVPEGMFAGGI